MVFPLGAHLDAFIDEGERDGGGSLSQGSLDSVSLRCHLPTAFSETFQVTLTHADSKQVKSEDVPRRRP